ncbi:hypothetical protein [Catenovulum adriaticum]|uniref:Lipoprotein n=1 Tax=Catenovulum adriaticum TaxID=2984846 RepID=A0ABY7APZ0_9ALTE|nr:hypothetical protein [Catenovulum sp. TS8]WAJ71342.1 hypothetical protein OLW01_05975 [Catenovulum sp. TS8]
MLNLKKAIKLFAFSAVISMLAGTLSACNKASAYQTSQALNASNGDIPKTIVQNVKQTFQAKFVYGDWRFQGTEVTNNSINAYIQIPNKLDMSEDQQQAYINQMICPAAQQTDFWNELATHELWVHIYTYDKRSSVQAQCKKPNV